MQLAREIVGHLDGWVNVLAAPLRPLREVHEPDGSVRLEFREHTPQTLLVGKAIRAVSGLRAAILLADLGYCAESAALLRTVSTFCAEIMAVAETLQSRSAPSAIKKFVHQYFEPRARTPQELAARERESYVGREELLKALRRLCERTEMDPDLFLQTHRFLDHTFDAFVHGSSQTSAELYNPQTRDFMMRGQELSSVRQDYVEAAAGKVHGVVAAIELTAKVFGNAAVAMEARAARRALDLAASTTPASKTD